VFEECPPQSIIICTMAIIAMPRDGLIPDGNQKRSSLLGARRDETAGFLLFGASNFREKHFGSHVF
jgi:hypothetical protein